MRKNQHPVCVYVPTCVCACALGKHLCANYRYSAYLHAYMVLPSPTTCGRVWVAGLGDGSLRFVTIKTVHPQRIPPTLKPCYGINYPLKQGEFAHQQVGKPA